METKSVLRILSHKVSNIRAPQTGGQRDSLLRADQRREQTGRQGTAFEHSEATTLVLAARLGVRTAKISVLKTELGH